MINELLQFLISVTLITTAALFIVLLLRRIIRQQFGATIAYQIWFVVPMALLAILIPKAPVVRGPSFASAPIEQLVSYATPVVHASESSWPKLVVLLWLTGCVMTVIWFWRQHRHYLRKLGDITQLPELGQGIYQANTHEIGPALVGLLRPRIIVPSDFFTRYTVEEQQLAIAHEKIHFRRGDAHVNLLCALAQCAFWFNPLIHIAAHCFRIDQELACDAKVMVKHPQSRRTYAEAMLKTQLSEPRTIIGCHLQSHPPLKERIMNLHHASPRFIKRITGNIVVSALIGFSTYGAWAFSPSMPQDGGITQDGQQGVSDKKEYRLRAFIEIRGLDMFQVSFAQKEGKQFDLSELLSDSVGDPNWKMAYTITPGNDDAVASLDMVIKRDGNIYSQHKVTVPLKQASRIQDENLKMDFTISLVDDAKATASPATPTLSLANGQQAPLPARMIKAAQTFSPDSVQLSIPKSNAVIAEKNCIKPRYPDAALQAGESGMTMLAILVGSDGSVVDSKIVRSSGSEALDEATRSAMSLCKFVPAVVNGQPQETWSRLAYKWVLPPETIQKQNTL